MQQRSIPQFHKALVNDTDDTAYLKFSFIPGESGLNIYQNRKTNKNGVSTQKDINK